MQHLTFTHLAPSRRPFDTGPFRNPGPVTAHGLEPSSDLRTRNLTGRLVQPDTVTR